MYVKRLRAILIDWALYKYCCYYYYYYYSNILNNVGDQSN